MILAWLSEAAKEALMIDRATYEYQSDFAKGYYNEGRNEGLAEGRAELAKVVHRLLEKRFGPLSEETASHVQTANQLPDYK